MIVCDILPHDNIALVYVAVRSVCGYRQQSTRNHYKNDVVKCYGVDQRRSSSNPATSTKPPPPGGFSLNQECHYRV